MAVTYHGLDWCKGNLPHEKCEWPENDRVIIGPDNDQDDISAKQVKKYLKGKLWVWPAKLAYFFCDQHADAEAFFLSLVASGGIKKTGEGDDDFELTPEGQEAAFIIGGDCFDKGPNNLRLLDVVKNLIDKGVDVKLLCGNHDLRTYLGIYYAESKDPKLDHLFVRMGKKTVPLLKEIYDRYVDHSSEAFSISEEEIKRRLFPAESWYRDFPRVAVGLIHDLKLERELVRIKEKVEEFEARIQSFGLSMNMVYAAVLKFRELFFEEEGKYYWFFNQMELAYRDGSYLFVHGGVDDSVSQMLHEHDYHELNKAFHRTLKEDPFMLYHGRLGNVFRTKYKEFDFPLTKIGTQALRHAGIHAIVHGHRNVLHGHRMVIRKGILNFECDVSVDCNTRSIEGLENPGAGVVIFKPDGEVLGISTDFPYIKSFAPPLITIT